MLQYCTCTMMSIWMKFTCAQVHIREETYNMSHCFISRDTNDGTTRTKVSQIESSPLKNN